MSPLLIGIAAGTIVVAGTLWAYRREWLQGVREILGVDEAAGSPAGTPGRSRVGSASRKSWVVAGCLLAVAIASLVTVTADNEELRVVAAISAAIFLLGGVFVFADRRWSR